MSDKPLCPDCGRPKVWLSSPGAWICFKCEDPPEELLPPWWFWLILLAIALFAVSMMFGVWKYDVHIGNLTQAWEEPDTGMSADQVKMIIYFGIIALVGSLVAYAMARGKERCPACGEVLKRTPTGHYYCMHCRSMYDPEDIEVGVVE